MGIDFPPNKATLSGMVTHAKRQRDKLKSRVPIKDGKEVKTNTYRVLYPYFLFIERLDSMTLNWGQRMHILFTGKLPKDL